MLKVIKIKHILFLLFGGKGVKEGTGNFHQHVRHWADFLHVRHHLSGLLEEELLRCLLDGGLHFIAQLLHLLFFQGIACVLAGSRQAAEGNGLDVLIELLVRLAIGSVFHLAGFPAQELCIHLRPVFLHADCLAEAHLPRPLAG